jgi:hypothetical protein
VAAAAGSEAALKASTAMHALRRIGEPQEAAAAIAFLLHPSNSFITGQVRWVPPFTVLHFFVSLVPLAADLWPSSSFSQQVGCAAGVGCGRRLGLCPASLMLPFLLVSAKLPHMHPGILVNLQ